MRRLLEKQLAILILSMILIAAGRGAFGAGPIGPPEGFASEDRSAAVGGGYFWSETEWKPKDKSAFPSNIKLGQNIAFLHAGTVIFEAGEAYVRLGAADLKETDGAFEGDYVPMASVGLKGLWIGDAGRRRRPGLGFGPILQGSYHQKYKDESVPLGSGETANVEIDKFWDVSVALALQYRINEQLLVFGGPIGYYSKADVRLSTSSLGQLSSNFQANKYLGGYAGVRFTPYRGLILEAEGQFLSGVSGGVTLAYRF